MVHIVQCTLGIMNIVGGLGSLIPGNAEDDTIDWASVAFGLSRACCLPLCPSLPPLLSLSRVLSCTLPRLCSLGLSL